MKSSVLLIMMTLLLSCSGQKEPNLPNIVLIMSDDQGWGDTGYNGHPYLKTPALDSMAANGITFTRFYAAAPVCSPTRGSVLTGRHPNRYGICSANCGHLPDEELTLAEIALKQGYTTGHFGKWHLGTLTRDTVDANRGGRPENDKHYAPPWEHGFEVCFSTESKVPTWDPMVVPSSSAGDVKPSLTEGGPFGTYYWTGPGKIETDNLQGDDSRVIMDRVIPFISNAHENDQPFFAVIWFHSPHLPVLTSDHYAGLYQDVSVDQQQYYGTITAMDEQIGRLRNRLKEMKAQENTIIFFTSDNGPEGIMVDGLGSQERTIGRRTQGITKGLRARKRSLYEGGIRVPGLLEWPGKLGPVTIDQPCFTSDYFPTLVNIMGFSPDKTPGPIDGVDLMGFIDGPDSVAERNLMFSFREQVAVINGRYKLYSQDKGISFKLFDLLQDPGETTDISAQYPSLKESLIGDWVDWDKSVMSSMNGSDYR